MRFYRIGYIKKARILRDLWSRDCVLDIWIEYKATDEFMPSAQRSILYMSMQNAQSTVHDHGYGREMDVAAARRRASYLQHGHLSAPVGCIDLFFPHGLVCRTHVWVAVGKLAARCSRGHDGGRRPPLHGYAESVWQTCDCSLSVSSGAPARGAPSGIMLPRGNSIIHNA